MPSSSVCVAVAIVALLIVCDRLHAEPDPAYKALDGWRMLGTALPYALKGEREAIHDCFLASYLRASSPFLGGEDLIGIRLGLSALLLTRGDGAFSQALGVERPEVVAAVKFWIRRSAGLYRGMEFKRLNFGDYPRTRKVLDAVPDDDFLLNEDSPRRPALLKQLSR